MNDEGEPRPLPTLYMERVRTINDFEVERLVYSCSANSLSEAKQGIDHLLGLVEGGR